MERFSPAAVAGTFDQLIALGKLQFRVTHTVICLSWHLDGLLSAGQRDQLWNLFGVPVFEQYLGANNVLLAYECEAHTGLHTTPAYKGPSITGHCQCKDGVRACFLPRFALAASASG